MDDDKTKETTIGKPCKDYSHLSEFEQERRAIHRDEARAKYQLENMPGKFEEAQQVLVDVSRRREIWWDKKRSQQLTDKERRSTESYRKWNRDYSREYSKRPEQIQKQKEYYKSTHGKAKRKIRRLRTYNNRFIQMKEKDPTLEEMDDIGLKYLASELERLIREDSDAARRDRIATKLLPYTSRAKPMQVEHSGEVTHTQLIANDAMSKLTDLLQLDDPSIVATVPKGEAADVEIVEED